MIKKATECNNKMALVELYSYGLITGYNKNKCILELEKLRLDESLGIISMTIKLLLDDPHAINNNT